ncbi:aspartate-semialdehyde dehydrogenase, partial [Xanthomonas citri pv. citri]|nr:aspartate-semialdehyde dehydrogenase [Xanthomonas citri pv. citri]
YSTIQILITLTPLHHQYNITHINITTYQSISNNNHSALKKLNKQTNQLLNFQQINPQHFPIQITFNLIPHINNFLKNNFTKKKI